MSDTVLPPLLNETLIKRALQNLHKQNKCILKVCEFKLLPANGENFGSEIYQVDAQYELNGNIENNSFIVKIVLPDMEEQGSNEEIMLNTVLPVMENYLKVLSDTSDHSLHAKCLLSEKQGKNECYVLENLNTLGYYCADRTKGLDLKQTTIVMKKLGKFHAASMLFNKNFPEIVDSLLNSPFEKGACDDISQAITYGGFEYVAKMVKNWPTYETLADKILAIIPKYNSLAWEVVNAKSSKFNVINHGDLWVNNFLYKYDKNTNDPTDVLFVDFQLCFWGSCGFDINWLLNSSLQLNVLKIQRENLIQTYYKSLKETLKNLNYPTEEVPSLDDVRGEIKRCEFIGFYISLCEFPIFALAKSHSQGLDCKTFCEPDKMKELRVLLYGNPRVQETLRYSLKYFEEINLL